uniref:Uncharacterized protein n=1 Tax=Cacopsylla melanoneura TaxID=428564 RepID=A0A8D8TJT1_9HEMI
MQDVAASTRRTSVVRINIRRPPDPAMRVVLATRISLDVVRMESLGQWDHGYRVAVVRTARTVVVVTVRRLPPTQPRATVRVMCPNGAAVQMESRKPGARTLTGALIFRNDPVRHALCPRTTGRVVTSRSSGSTTAWTTGAATGSGTVAARATETGLNHWKSVEQCASNRKEKTYVSCPSLQVPALTHVAPHPRSSGTTTRIGDSVDSSIMGGVLGIITVSTQGRTVRRCVERRLQRMPARSLQRRESVMAITHAGALTRRASLALSSRTGAAKAMETISRAKVPVWKNAFIRDALETNVYYQEPQAPVRPKCRAGISTNHRTDACPSTSPGATGTETISTRDKRARQCVRLVLRKTSVFSPQ